MFNMSHNSHYHRLKRPSNCCSSHIGYHLSCEEVVRISQLRPMVKGVEELVGVVVVNCDRGNRLVCRISGVLSPMLAFQDDPVRRI
jgi:hypothetical protein